MKTNLILTTVTAFAVIAASSLNIRAAETNSTSARIGIYDSRAVAYAWFWSGEHQKELYEMMQSARAAKTNGDTNRFAELSAALNRHQDEMHREVFSIAPATEALAELKTRLPEIQKSAGVSDLVSKWDEAALKKYSAAEKVDVTDTLVREFIAPTAEQQKTLSEMEKVKPLPLDECNELIRKNEI